LANRCCPGLPYAMAIGTLARRHVTIPGTWREKMGAKLQQGDRFPSLTLKLVDGGTMRLPDEMPTRYAAVLTHSPCSGRACHLRIEGLAIDGRI
jgi:hypothetical protein